MQTLKLNKISEVKTEKERSDSKIKRQYYTGYFSDATNPFAPMRQQNFFQSHNEDGSIATWKAGDPSIVKQYLGKEIPGAFITRTVNPYQIGEKTVTSATCVVLGEVNEVTIERAFKANGLTINSNTSNEVKVINSSAEALNM